MGGAVDVVSDFVSDTTDMVVDFVDNTIDATVNLTVDLVTDPEAFLDDIGEGVTNFYKEVVQPIGDFAIDATYEVFNALVYEPFEALLTPIGQEGIIKDIQYAHQGINYLAHQTLDGNWKAALQLAVVIGLVWLTVASMGATSGATTAVTGAYAAGVTSTAVLMTAYYGVLYIGLAMSIYSLYGITVALSDLGKIISAGGTTSFFRELANQADAMRLSFVNSWINGRMNLWMAGGVLYDSPRAGDVLFNPTGDLNTTQFLSRPDTNSNTWSKWNNGEMHDFQSSVNGNLAGDEFFSISPISQRM